MRITPLDVRKQEFNKSMRGYDGDEVRAFLNTLADEYETVLVDNKQIRERVMEQDEKISDYQTLERTLRDTLMTAERVMQETRENATREGELIVQEAQLTAKGIMEECRLRTEELRREIVGLRKEKDTYLARFRGLAEAQINFIDTHESDFEDLDRRLVDIVDNVVTGTVVKSELIAAKTAPAAHASPLTSPTSAPTTPAAPTADFTAPAVAPVPTAAPVAAESDIWRDYDPNQTESPDSEMPAFEPMTIETTRPVVAEEEVAGNIADLVSESLAETGGHVEAHVAEKTDRKLDEAAVALESLTIDVISRDNGDRAPTEAANI